MVLHKIAENVAAPVPFRLPPKAARAAASALAVMWLQKTSSLTTSGSQLRMFGFKFPDPSERLLIKLGGDNLMLENVEVGPSNYDKRQNMAEQRSPFFPRSRWSRLNFLSKSWTSCSPLCPAASGPLGSEQKSMNTQLLRAKNFANLL